ncbi:g4208 [Coccomyxa elongata]
MGDLAMSTNQHMQSGAAGLDQIRQALLAQSPNNASALQQQTATKKNSDLPFSNGVPLSGPGKFSKSKYMGVTQNGLPCDPFDVPPGSICINNPLPTPWSADVDPNNPWPEYPRPQMSRERWQNLNGIWEFEPYGVWEDKPLPPSNSSLPKRIVVPFPVEAPLSGVGRSDVGTSRMWYRRNFTIPQTWEVSAVASSESPERLLLHFGAVDWEAEVFVNGQRMGLHRGGYDKFSFDITGALKHGQRGAHELAVRVFDPTEFAHVPTGKQRRHPQRHPSGIWYTSSSGIWQTVWLEPVPATHIERLDIIPDIDAANVSITVLASPAARNQSVHVIIFDKEGRKVGKEEGAVGVPFNVTIGGHKSSKLHLWSSDSPYLYDLQVSLQEGSSMDAAGGDTVKSYVGMRKVSLGKVGPGNHLRPMLNNEFVFQLGFLDQGFWPDGVYTAPTDKALQHDIIFAKTLGYNLLRKHIKVEPDRWYYHCDRLGMLVWQDMPAMYWEDPFSQGEFYRADAEKAQFEHELTRMIDEHRSFPCIITYIVFNEGWGQYETLRVVEYAKSLDASRLFDGASGWVDFPVGDLVDMHAYVGPNSPGPTATRAAVLGEFGGLGLRVEGHLWIPEDAYCYEMEASPAALEVRYLGLVEQLKRLVVDPVMALSAAVYTELSDVEAEINGLTTYDRQVVKVEPYALLAAHKSLMDLARSLNHPAVQSS